MSVHQWLAVQQEHKKKCLAKEIENQHHQHHQQNAAQKHQPVSGICGPRMYKRKKTAPGQWICIPVSNLDSIKLEAL